MKRKLLRQMSNEWQSNAWLAVELLIVSVVIWFLADSMYTKISIFNEPRGFDTEHCYLLLFDKLSDKSPDYKEYESRNDENEDLKELVERLKIRPEIEAVALSRSSYPYNYSNSGATLSIDSFSTAPEFCVMRCVTPDFLKVFRYTGTHGETPEQLAEMLKNNPEVIFASDNIYNTYGIESLEPFIGRKFHTNATDDSVKLAAALNVVRYSDYSGRHQSFSMIRAMPEKSYRSCSELVVRVKDNMDKNFAENIMEDAWKSLHVGNYYISSVKSFSDIRDSFSYNDRNDVRNTIIGGTFLLVNIFLGLLGAFWFRTQQRVSEIAIRKVNGASSWDIFRRVIGEGEIILLIVIPLAILLDYLLVHFELNSRFPYAYFEPVRFVTCVIVSSVLMALMIALGIAIPAYKAMKMQPAIALSEE